MRPVEFGRWHLAVRVAPSPGRRIGERSSDPGDGPARAGVRTPGPDGANHPRAAHPRAPWRRPRPREPGDPRGLQPARRDRPPRGCRSPLGAPQFTDLGGRHRCRGLERAHRLDARRRRVRSRGPPARHVRPGARRVVRAALPSLRTKRRTHLHELSADRSLRRATRRAGALGDPAVDRRLGGVGALSPRHGRHAGERRCGVQRRRTVGRPIHRAPRRPPTPQGGRVVQAAVHRSRHHRTDRPARQLLPAVDLPARVHRHAPLGHPRRLSGIDRARDLGEGVDAGAPPVPLGRSPGRRRRSRRRAGVSRPRGAPAARDQLPSRHRRLRGRPLLPPFACRASPGSTSRSIVRCSSARTPCRRSRTPSPWRRPT